MTRLVMKFGGAAMDGLERLRQLAREGAR